MKNILILFIIVFACCINEAKSQEMFIQSEVAANMAKNRKQLDLFVNGNSDIGSYTSYIGFQYGITGNLTSMNRLYISTNKKEPFLGDLELGGSYRLFSHDKKNFHVRLSSFAHLKIPMQEKNTTSAEIISSRLITDLYRSENYVLNLGGVFTRLSKKLAINVDGSYNIVVPKGEYKFGNYFKGGVSIGYLIFPAEYKGYDDINVNLYFESKYHNFAKNQVSGLDLNTSGGNKLELMAGTQFIFNSSILLELGYVHSIGDKNLTFEKDIYFSSIRFLFF